MNRSNGADLSTPPSPASVVGNIAGFGNDVITLAELQAQLTLIDARECLSRATTPFLAMAAGAVVALGSIPVILLGVADLISKVAQISPGASRLIVSLVALGAAGAIGYLSLKAVTGSLTSFRRSTEELTRNVSWLRSVLVHSGKLGSRPRP